MDETNQKNYNSSLAIITALFFMWGYITVMNDVLIPYLKSVFELNHTKAMLVQSAFFGAYFIGSLIYFFISAAKGDPINRIGYKNGIIIGLITAGTGTLLFYPSAEYHSYGFFLAALFIIGLGLTMLQIAANPYAAILGPEKTAAGRLNLAQGINSLGTTLAPVTGALLIFKIYGEELGADSVKVPYLIFASMFFLLAVFINFAKLPRFTNQYKIEKGAGALRYPQLVLGMVAIFMYVGSEVSIGSIMTSYLGLDEIAGLAEKEAGGFVSMYWAGLMIGRFIGAISLSKMRDLYKNILTILLPVIAFLVIAYLKGWELSSYYGIVLVLNMLAFFAGKSLPARALYIFAFINIALLITAVSTQGATAMWAIIGTGLFNSIMWSNIFTLSIAGLGKYTSQGSSLLVMAILGGAIIPLIQGAVADSIGVHMSFIVPILPYLYIAFYGLKGYKIRKK